MKQSAVAAVLYTGIQEVFGLNFYWIDGYPDKLKIWSSVI